MSSSAPTDPFGWLLNQNLYDPGIRYRGATPEAYAGDCPHDCEGGVDVPAPVGEPIYALADGILQGSGTFCHDAACNSPGYGVVTELITGVGDVYYQHIDISPDLPTCSNGNCDNYMVHRGQLIGYTHIAEVEVGVNPDWGGIWGPNPKPGPWLDDPRATIIALAKGDISGAISTASCTDACAKQHNPITDPVGYTSCVAQCYLSSATGSVTTGIGNELQGLVNTWWGQLKTTLGVTSLQNGLARAGILGLGVVLVVVGLGIGLKSLSDATGFTEKVESKAEEAGEAAATGGASEAEKAASEAAEKKGKSKAKKGKKKSGGKKEAPEEEPAAKKETPGRSSSQSASRSVSTNRPDLVKVNES